MHTTPATSNVVTAVWFGRTPTHRMFHRISVPCHVETRCRASDTFALPAPPSPYAVRFGRTPTHRESHRMGIPCHVETRGSASDTLALPASPY